MDGGELQTRFELYWWVWGGNLSIFPSGSTAPLTIWCFLCKYTFIFPYVTLPLCFKHTCNAHLHLSTFSWTSLDLPHCLTSAPQQKWDESSGLCVLFSFKAPLWKQGHRPHVRRNTGPSQEPSKCPIHAEELLNQSLKIRPTDVVAA